MSQHTAGSGPGPDEAAVTAWLEGLAWETEIEREGAVGRNAPHDFDSPTWTSPPEALDDAGGDNRDPWAQVWFSEGMRAASRGGRGVNKKYRDLYGILQRNVRRYLSFTRLRLAHLYAALKPRDRTTFSAIPYLLHVNQSGLPGFQPNRFPSAPHGICNFELNDVIRSAAQELFGPQIRRQKDAILRPAIDSLLIMGSVGTIGQSGKSDVDYWVVVDENRYSPKEMELLGRKIEVVEAWANRRGLDVHFFLVDPRRTRANDFGGAASDGESCGTAQGKLLKEEFYRTAIFLQGQLPLWWVVPVGVSDREYDQLDRLLSRQPLAPSLAHVDLGIIGRIDRGEFFGAALWQINKSLKSPFKSLLKMGLIARYLDDERLPLLADILKARVLEGEDAPEFTDPYVLLFDAISEYYAERGHWADFRLVQKCFYLKVGMKLSRETSGRTKSLLRLRIMRGYIGRWGWDESLLAELDDIESWSAARVDELGQEIRAFMLRIYRYTLERAGEATVKINQEDVTILGRRLFACFADESDKIQHLFTYFLKEPRVEERLTLLEVPEATVERRWEIHTALSRDELEGRPEPLWWGRTLPRAAAWLSYNGLFSRQTVVSLRARHNRTGATEFRAMLDRLELLIDQPDPFSIAPSTFLEPRRITRVAVAINFDGELTAEHLRQEQGLVLVAQNWDVLNHGRERESLVLDVVVVVVNSWGEMFCTRYAGGRAIIEVLHDLVMRLDPCRPLDEPLAVLTPSGRWATAIRSRVEQIFDEIRHAFVDELGECRSRAYVYESNRRFQIYRQTRERRLVLDTGSLRGVVRVLGSVGVGRQDVRLDNLSPSLAPYRALLEKRRNDRDARISIGWRIGTRIGRIIVLDEEGKFHETTVAATDLEAALVRRLRFVVHHLRSRVRDAQALRRALRVYEFSGGQSMGEPVQLRDDMGRIVGLLAKSRVSGPLLALKGDLRHGRDGVYFKWGADVVSPRQWGRAVFDQLVRRILEDHSLYDIAAFAITRSDVAFGRDFLDDEGHDVGIVKHLRLTDIYEGQLRAALERFQGAARRRVLSRSPFRLTPRATVVQTPEAVAS